MSKLSYFDTIMHILHSVNVGIIETTKSFLIVYIGFLTDGHLDDKEFGYLPQYPHQSSVIWPV